MFLFLNSDYIDLEAGPGELQGGKRSAVKCPRGKEGEFIGNTSSDWAPGASRGHCRTPSSQRTSEVGRVASMGEKEKLKPRDIVQGHLMNGGRVMVLMQICLASKLMSFVIDG